MLWTDRRWVLALALVLGLFLDLGTPPLFDRDEGAFSEATREMLESGDFVSPTLNSEPRYDKPILIYWAQAASVSLLGVNEWGFRIPSAVAVLLWTGFVVAFVAPRWGGRSAAAVGLILATSLGPMLIGRAAIADALLNLWVTLAMLEVWRWRERSEFGAKMRIYLWVGLGVLTKGPVAIIVPVGAMFLFSLTQRRLRPWLAILLDVRGWCVGLAVAAPWYALQFEREGRAFWEGFFLRHNLERFHGPLEGHGGSLFYYLPILLLVTLPFTGLWVGAFRRIGSAWREELSRFLWCWLIFVVVFFSLSGTKLPHYVLLAFTPMALLLGRQREGLQSRTFIVGPALFLWGLLLALPRFVPVIQRRLEDPYFGSLLESAPQVFGPAFQGVALGMVVVLLLLGLLPGRRRWERLVVIALLNAGAIAHFVAPAFGELLQGPVREAALVARDLDQPTVRVGVDLPSLSVYRGEALPRRLPDAGEIAITTTAELGNWSDPEILFRRGPLVVLRPGSPAEPPDRGPTASDDGR